MEVEAKKHTVASVMTKAALLEHMATSGSSATILRTLETVYCVRKQVG